MLTSFCYRSVKYISLYMLRLCDGFGIKLEPYLELFYIKISVEMRKVSTNEGPYLVGILFALMIA